MFRSIYLLPTAYRPSQFKPTRSRLAEGRGRFGTFYRWSLRNIIREPYHRLAGKAEGPGLHCADCTCGGSRWLWRTLVLLGLCIVSARADVSKEYQLKAAFLYNFTKFVQWPSQRFDSIDSPIVIGVLGGNPFDHELEKIVQGRTVNGRKISIAILSSAAEAKSVHLLFVNEPDKERLGNILASIRAFPVLTVGESEQFAELGGAITFKMETDKVRFEINQDRTEESGLKISAQLLKLATVVRKKS